MVRVMARVLVLVLVRVRVRVSLPLPLTLTLTLRDGRLGRRLDVVEGVAPGLGGGENQG